MDPWKILSIEFTDDVRKIKRAYAAKLKLHKPDVDPEGYQQLRDAFDFAKKIAISQANKSVREELPKIDEKESEGLNKNVEEISIQEETELKAVNGANVGIENNNETEVISVSETRDGLSENNDQDAQKNSEIERTEEMLHDLTQGIHDVLVEHGEIAGYDEFIRVLGIEELVSIDVSKQFELHVMDYLNWRAEQHFHHKAFLPSGFMRQVIKHYGWHQQMSTQYYQALESTYDDLVNNSGVNFLEKVANGTLKYNSSDFKPAAKILLGKYKPKRFLLTAMRKLRKDTIHKLLSDIEGLHDGSFDFELNTKTIKWWLNSRTSFLPNFWMVVLAGVLSWPILFFANDFLLPSLPSNLTVFILLPVVSFCISTFVLSIVVFKVSYYCSLGFDYINKAFIRFSPITQECIIAILAFGLLGLSYFLTPRDVDLQIVSIVILWLALTVIYRWRVLSMLIAFTSVFVGFEMQHGALANQSLSPYRALFIVVILNFLVFFMNLVFNKNNWPDWSLSGHKVSTVKVSRFKKFFLMILMCAFGFSYAYLIMGK